MTNARNHEAVIVAGQWEEKLLISRSMVKIR